MGELRPGILAMIYGLVVDVEMNGRCVTVVQMIPPGSDSYFCGLTGEWTEFSPDANAWWLCDDENYYMSKNLMPIDNTDPDLEKIKEKEKETT